MKKLLLVLFVLSFGSINNKSQAQAFDGRGINVMQLSYGLGENNYISLSGDSGWFDHFSTGFAFNYYPGVATFDTGDSFEEIFGVGLELRANIHGSNMLNMEKSDVLVGYFFRLPSVHGVHVAYHYYLKENFGFYVKQKSILSIPDNYFEDSRFSVEFGILYTFESPWGGGRRTF